MKLVTTVISTCLVAIISCNSNNDLVVTSNYRYIDVKWKESSQATVNKFGWQVVTSSTSAILGFYPGNTTRFIDLPINFSFNITIEYDLSDNPINWKMVKTKDSSVVPVNVIPGKPRNITVCNISNLNYVCFKTPLNVLNATTDNDKSVEYKISICHYNPLIKKNMECKMIGIWIGDNNGTQQAKFNVLSVGDGYIKERNFFKQFTFPTNRDIAVVVEPFALNGIAGEKDQFNVRLDPSTKPDAPSISGIEGVGKGMLITVNAPSGVIVTQYRIKYFKAGTSNFTETTATDTTINIDSLEDYKANTNYTVQVAIDDSNSGASDYSAPITVLSATVNASMVLKINLALAILAAMFAIKMMN